MGGVSHGHVAREMEDGQPVYRLTGSVSLENNGGFVQMAFDLDEGGRAFDASGWKGIELDTRGNDELYDLRLRTAQLTRPWQSFRTAFVAPRDWERIRFPFGAFDPHRTDALFDPACLRRLGVLAIGRVFNADVSVRSVAFYR